MGREGSRNARDEQRLEKQRHSVEGMGTGDEWTGMVTGKTRNEATRQGMEKRRRRPGLSGQAWEQWTTGRGGA